MASSIQVSQRRSGPTRITRLTRSQRETREVDASRTVSARLSLTSQALARLLSISGSQSQFVLSSLDGSTSVKVRLAIASVPDAAIKLGKAGMELDLAQSTLSRRGQSVGLTRMELRLLGALLEDAPDVSLRARLIARLWPGSKACRELEYALPVWVHALRRRFSALGLSDAILTVRHYGYRLSMGVLD